MKNLYVEFEDSANPDGPKKVVFDVTPDLADAIREGLAGLRDVTGPRRARSFEELTQTLAQTARLINHLDTFRELCAVEADKTNVFADRKAIGIASGLVPSRLYRILGKHGRPKNRTKSYAEQMDRAMGRGRYRTDENNDNE